MKACATPGCRHVVYEELVVCRACSRALPDALYVRLLTHPDDVEARERALALIAAPAGSLFAGGVA